ncbi:MAG: right-handed parallel beta-helix repeat-containing protein [Thermoplasmatales archaeon]|nr:right-handed parallel beta-helix repeat-containing protein [Thermoplasmatales archaeon]
MLIRNTVIRTSIGTGGKGGIGAANGDKGLGAGIYIGSSTNNNISSCNVSNNLEYGLYSKLSSYNNISNCQIYNNSYGIYFDSSGNNRLGDNSLWNNTDNFGVCGGGISDYYQDINISNTINGRPIYYLVEQSKVILDSISIGYLCLVSCINVTVRNLELKDNAQGLFIVNTTYSTVNACKIYNNSEGGIYLYHSSNNNISNCNVYNNYQWGIGLSCSLNNTLSNCYIYNNFQYNIYIFSSSSNNSIRNCTIHNVKWSLGVIPISVMFCYSSNNNIDSSYIYNNERAIMFSSSSNNNINNCSIHNNWGHGIRLLGSSGNQISACEIHNNKLAVLIWYSSNNKVTYCDIYNNSEYGVTAYDSKNIEVHYCNVYDNTDYGVGTGYYSGDPEESINATYNWWGNASGPSGLGSGGGDKVGGMVLYDPWLMKPWQEGIEISKPIEETGGSSEKTEETFDIIYPAAIGIVIAAGIIIAVLLLRKRYAMPKLKKPLLKPELITPKVSTITLRCPKCRQTFRVELKPKPFNVKCLHCGKEGVLR